MASAPVRFDTEEPGVEPIPFIVSGKRKGLDPDDPGRTVDGTFLARPDMSMGQLLVDMTAEGSTLQATMDFYESALVDENSNPDSPEDERTEFERFEDFIGDPDLYVSQKALNALAEWITEKSDDGGRPTGRSGDSRATRRSAARGSSGKRRKRG